MAFLLIGGFYEKRGWFLVGIIIAHMPDKHLVLFIFISGEDNGIRKSDNLVSWCVCYQDAIEFMPCFILFHLQLHGLVITAGQIAQVFKIMAVKGGDNILLVCHAADELFGLVSLHFTTAFTVIDTEVWNLCATTPKDGSGKTSYPDNASGD